MEQSTTGADCTWCGGGVGVVVDDSVVLDPIDTIDSLPTLLPRDGIASLPPSALVVFKGHVALLLCELVVIADEGTGLVPSIWLLLLLALLCIVPVVPRYLPFSDICRAFERFITIELLYAIASGIVLGLAC